MNALVTAARAYAGVRFCHRGRGPRALDCAGLVWAAARDCGVTLPDFRLYAREPSAHGSGLTDYVMAALGDPVAVAPVPPELLAPGSVLVLRFEKEPHHMAIVTDYPFGGLAMIHACGHIGRVVEHRLSDHYLGKITHAFRSPV